MIGRKQKYQLVVIDDEQAFCGALIEPIYQSTFLVITPHRELHAWRFLARVSATLVRTIGERDRESLKIACICVV